jgi:predicted 3-demethylubiquinone-9 3-methyltransferase (glyoxalase superfamily)
MQKIIPHLWFDREASTAARFYTSIFTNLSINNTPTLHDTPSGSVEILTIELSGQVFSMISADPFYKFTPSVSFLVACETMEEVDRFWSMLHVEGKNLMSLGAYPYSEKYGWLEDRFGLSWQIMYMGKREIKQRITPTLMFVGDQCGKTEEAILFYTSIFRASKVEDILRYGKNEDPDKEATIKHAAFTLEAQRFAAMDSSYAHEFSFNEAISLMVYCDTLEEIDQYWGKLSAYPKAEQCGWLKDKFGFSWQIVPTIMEELMQGKDPGKLSQIIVAFLKMKKFDILKLKQAAE